MRILDEDTDRPCNRVSIFLLRSEAGELRDTLEAALATTEDSWHEHVTSTDQQKEITLALYDEALLDQFNERVRTLIKFDK
jgi:plasmid stability protein